MFATCYITLHDVAKLVQSLLKRCKIRFVVDGRFVHVVEQLLYRIHQYSQRRVKRAQRLTRIVDIWQYVAGPSRVLPMVKKNNDSKLNTSDKVVSTRFLCDTLSSRTSLSFVTIYRMYAVSICVVHCCSMSSILQIAQGDSNLVRRSYGKD